MNGKVILDEEAGRQICGELPNNWAVIGVYCDPDGDTTALVRGPAYSMGEIIYASIDNNRVVVMLDKGAVSDLLVTALLQRELDSMGATSTIANDDLFDHIVDVARTAAKTQGGE